MTQPRAVPIIIDAVVITRNRIDLLRNTLLSIQNSTFPVRSIFVTDDSTDSSTKEMLAREFPHVVHLVGPRRGISANRNHGMRHSNADYILLSDDDMLVDTEFIQSAVAKAQEAPADLIFTATQDDGVSIMPNTLGFLGFANTPYRMGQPYDTANLQCFVLSQALAKTLLFDELITTYGYEEMDYSYRAAAAGFRIECIPTCVNTHLDPNVHFSFRPVQDAGRLYVTYKRAAVIDRKPFRAFLFVLVAVPHHLLALLKRDGIKGIPIAVTNVRLAFRMYRDFRSSQNTQNALAPSEQPPISSLGETP